MTALAAIAKALDRMNEIMQEPSVTAMRGEAYNDGEPELIKRAAESLKRIEYPTQTHVAEVMNRKHLAEVLKGMEKAQTMLDRVGFADVKGEAWVDRDWRVIEAGYEAAMQLSGRQR